MKKEVCEQCMKEHLELHPNYSYPPVVENGMVNCPHPEVKPFLVLLITDQPPFNCRHHSDHIDRE